MSAPSFRIPPNVWVDITDPEMCELVRDLINAHIKGEPLADKECTEISVSSLRDLPEEYGHPAPGDRHLEVRVTTAEAVIHCVVGIAGRPGSEVLGYTSGELEDATVSVRTVIRDLRSRGKPAKDSIRRLEEIERMLEHPTFEPSRWQPIARGEIAGMMVYAKLTGAVAE